MSEIPVPMLESPEQPAFPCASIADSRRLLGPNLYSDHPGALLEVTCEAKPGALAQSWATQARKLAASLGWKPADVVTRQRKGGGLELFLSAPVDVLMTATVVCEQAWVAAESGARIAPSAVTVLKAAAEAERQTCPNLQAVYAEAVARGVSATFDDELLSLGSGAGCTSWPVGEIPAATSIPWRTLSDVPVALVTGSNGKTTTTRLVAAMWRLAGAATGWSCSDGVWVDDERLASGDYSGPAGARTVLRHRSVKAAVLETARGGILRRGLAVQRANAAIITNISADHFGEYGVDSLRELADVKGVVARALGPDGVLVLNADDPELVSLGARLDVPMAWFSVSNTQPAVHAHVAAGGDVAIVENGRVMLHRKGRWHDLGGVDSMPLTMRGAARHNIENILGAALLGVVTGVPVQSLRATLARFGSSADDNPGRLQVYRFGGATVFVDYAHNPEGLAALCETASAVAAKRRLLLLGQAGNRDDTQLRALARSAWAATPFNRVVIKEMPTMLRGRAVGEIPRVLSDELVKLGLAKKEVEVVGNELDALRRAFTWAKDGDVLVCPVHVEKAAAYAWLERLQAAGWKAGKALPT